VVCFSERLKEVTFAVDKEWNIVFSAYKQHGNALTIDRLCTATALRPSIAEQMAALDQLNRQLQAEYPYSHWLNCRLCDIYICDIIYNVFIAVVVVLLPVIQHGLQSTRCQG